MRNLLSRREVSAQSPHAYLKNVWYVDADFTYSVDRRQDVGEDSFIAVRTLTGEGTMSLMDGSARELRSNSLIIVRCMDIAGYAASKSGWQFYWFEFDMLGGAPERLGVTLEIHMSAQERIELERCFVSLGSGDARECAVADALISYLLADWQLRAIGVGAGGMSPQEIVTLLEKGRREKLSIGELAREAGMCERSFRDAAREATGLAPKAYQGRDDRRHGAAAHQLHVNIRDIGLLQLFQPVLLQPRVQEVLWRIAAARARRHGAVNMRRMRAGACVG